MAESTASTSMVHNTKPTAAFLRSKVRVGSCKGPTDYRFKEHVFHTDDTPAHVKQAKQDMVRWKQRRIVGEHTAEWNKSTATGARDDRPGSYAYNYRAEQTYPVLAERVDKSSKFHIATQTMSDVQQILSKQNDPVQRGTFKRTQELPNHPDLMDATPWNNSAVLSIHERDEAQRKLQERANRRTKARRKAVRGVALSATDMISEQVRAAKREGRFESKRSTVSFESRRPPNTGRSIQSQAQTRTSSRNVERRNFHSGKWEYNEQEGRHMWSDTGSFVFESRGDVIVTSNRDRWNLSDWTNS